MRDMGQALRLMRVFWNLIEMMTALVLNILHTSELYTLKRLILCYVNFSSMKQF